MIKLYKVNLQTDHYEVDFISTSPGFSSTYIVPDQNVHRETILAIIDEIGEENYHLFSNDGKMGIDVNDVSEKSIKIFKMLFKEKNINEFADFLYDFKVRQDSVEVNLVKLGIYSQISGLLLALFILTTIPKAPFTGQAILPSILALIALIFPVFLQISFKILQKNIRDAFADIGVKIENKKDFIKEATSLNDFLSKSSIFNITSLYLYIKSKKR